MRTKQCTLHCWDQSFYMAKVRVEHDTLSYEDQAIYTSLLGPDLLHGQSQCGTWYTLLWGSGNVHSIVKTSPFAWPKSEGSVIHFAMRTKQCTLHSWDSPLAWPKSKGSVIHSAMRTKQCTLHCWDQSFYMAQVRVEHHTLCYEDQAMYTPLLGPVLLLGKGRRGVSYTLLSGPSNVHFIAGTSPFVHSIVRTSPFAWQRSEGSVIHLVMRTKQCTLHCWDQPFCTLHC